MLHAFYVSQLWIEDYGARDVLEITASCDRAHSPPRHSATANPIATITMMMMMLMMMVMMIMTTARARATLKYNHRDSGTLGDAAGIRRSNPDEGSRS